jgi:glucosylglycerate phosphorylase
MTAGRSYRQAGNDETLKLELEHKLAELYGRDTSSNLADQLAALAANTNAYKSAQPLNESDIILIAYGDHLKSASDGPLATLRRFVDERLGNSISGVHVLPFHPATSDGGFAVADYDSVDQRLGTWSDIEALADKGQLMADFVLNHVSASHPWFASFLAGEPRYANFFITPDTDFDFDNVVRARATPLLTPFDTAGGPVRVWTTFGPDQIDLNYRNSDVLVEMAKAMLNFVAHGATVLRFDATHFLWKESGSTCVNLPEAHLVIQILRIVLDLVDPEIIIISETNIPHDENITYFGNGHNEAQMVYNFALPSLLVHTLHTGNAERMTEWARSLETPSDQTCFFNYTACHDGISVRGSAQILSVGQRRAMIQRSIDHGGRILYRSTPTGDIPYEMNITYYDVLSPWQDELAMDRFLVSQAVSLAMAGVPAVYLSSLFGAHTWQDGFLDGGGSREVNRQRYDLEELSRQLDDESCRRGQVFSAYQRLLRARRCEPAFHPQGAQEVLDCGPGVFGLTRRSLDASRTVVALHNVTDSTAEFELAEGRWQSLLSEEQIQGKATLRPYGIAWLLAPSGS